MNEKCSNCGGPVYPHDPDSEMPVFVCPRCSYYTLKECRERNKLLERKYNALSKAVNIMSWASLKVGRFGDMAEDRELPKWSIGEIRAIQHGLNEGITESLSEERT